MRLNRKVLIVGCVVAVLYSVTGAVAVVEGGFPLWVQITGAALIGGLFGWLDVSASKAPA